MKTTTEMQLVPIAKLVPYVNNARTHSPEQITKLRSSLREFGFINPVIIDRAFNVIAGHGRILAAKEEGITEVPCVFADHLSEAQKKAYIIADNRMAMDAGWDEELLRVEIESLQGMGGGTGEAVLFQNRRHLAAWKAYRHLRGLHRPGYVPDTSWRYKGQPGLHGRSVFCQAGKSVWADCKR